MASIVMRGLDESVKKQPAAQAREHGRSMVLAFDDEAAAHYAAFLVAGEQAGLPISTADAQIAAICRSHGATCSTRSTKDFDLTGVEHIDPWVT